MKNILLAMVVLAVSAVSAQDAMDQSINGSYHDTWDDAPEGLDIRSIDWSLGPAAVTVHLDSTLPEDAAVTAILFVGTVGDAEPEQAYILHHGPEGERVLLAQNGTAPGMQVQVRNGTIDFQLDTAVSAPCTFAVARTVTYATEGQTVRDVVGWSGTDIGAAWDEGTACTDGAPQDIVIDSEDTDEALGIPAPGMLAVGAALLVGVAWRRSQR